MVRPHRAAGLTFSFSPTEGYRGLVKDRATIVILASGSDFITGMNRGRVDMAAPYLRDILRFIGVHDLRFVAIGPTVGAAGPVAAAREAAERRLVELAATS
jgi:FMN-dependent NADH-azoreductase